MSEVDMSKVDFDNAEVVSAAEYAGVSLVRNLEVVAAEINVIKCQTASVIKRSIFEIGKRLCEAKAMIGHGNWEVWLCDNVSYSETTARTLMRAYREMGDEQVDMLTGEAPADVFESLNLSQMVALFPLPQHERVAFVKEHDVADKSVREIEALVAEAVERGRAEGRGELEGKLAEAEEARAKAEIACDKAVAAKDRAAKKRDELALQLDKIESGHEAEVRELREKADKLAKELDEVKNAPVQERIVYVEKEGDTSSAPAGHLPLEGEGLESEAQAKVDALAAQLDEVQGKLKEAEARAEAMAQKADMHVQAVNFALREIAGKVADIGDAIDEIEDHELVVKLREAATKAIKSVLEGAEWYGKV